jgi:DNA-binding response OmpR family regulator/KaiC/GvpD/RAD55 family RecA-like ATPase
MNQAMWEAQKRTLLASGIEPVDKILGGLEAHRLYLAHGEAAGKSLFGFKFLIEGLKRGETVALVTGNAPEDAVRRFARLGYDCLQDIQQNRLLILEYDHNPFARQNDLMTILRELDWRLRGSEPQRLVVDPVLPLIQNKGTNAPGRAQEFMRWAASFNATVLLIGNGEYKELQPMVHESFRFEIINNGETATRYFTFEKSPDLPSQAIEVDPRRGVFLLHRPMETAIFNEKLPARDEVIQTSLLSVEIAPVPPRATTPEMEARQNRPSPPHAENRRSVPAVTTSDEASKRTSAGQSAAVVPFPLKTTEDSPVIALPNAQEAQAGEANFVSIDLEWREAPKPKAGTPMAQPITGFDDFLKEVQETIADLHLDEIIFLAPDDVVPFVESIASEALPISPIEKLDERRKTLAATGRRVSDRLFRRQVVERERRGAMERRQPVPSSSPTITAKDCTILVITEDALLCKRLESVLQDYSVTIIQDTVKGIANAMSLNPDLIILNMDLPMMDGFKVLAQLRASLTAPIITVSQTRQRASDRIHSIELGSDYFLTKPLSLVELKQKVKQLLARARGIDSWLSDATTLQNSLSEMRRDREAQSSGAAARMMPAGKATIGAYEDFIAEVEKRVKTAMQQGGSFSIVGVSLEALQRESGAQDKELFALVSQLMRTDDLLTTNPRLELVALLNHTDANGAKAFIRRVRQSVANRSDRDLPIWVRSFPSFEEERVMISKAAIS